MVAALGMFLTAIAMKSDDVKRVGLGAFVAVALLSIPAFVTGTAALLALKATPEFSPVMNGMIETHEDAAFFALALMELTGVLAWLGLWQYRRQARIPQATITAVLILSLVTFGLMSRAAMLGGEIRHPEIRTAAVQAQTEPTLTRVIGNVMSEDKRWWPLSETFHFLGLCLLFGVVLVVNLRMLGFLEGIPFSALHRLLPWAVVGFGVNTATGMLFFVGAPPSFYVTSPVFFWKLALILVAAANALYFTVFEQPWSLTATGAPPLAARIAAASGICLWVAVIFCGQMLPFIGRSF